MATLPAPPPPIVTKELSPAKRQLLQQRLRGLKSERAELIEPRAPSVRLPMTFAQQQIWMHTAIEPGSPIYNEAITIHKRGGFELRTMEAALNEFLHRHEAWRTSFAVDGGEAVQVIAPELRVSLKMVNLTDYPDPEAEACRRAGNDAAEVLYPEVVPLFRATVYRLAPDHHWLQLTLHHIIFDGVSIYRTVVPELAALYAAYDAGLPSPLAPVTLQYGDYAVWHERQREGAEIARHLAYWKQALAGELPVLRLPLDRARVPGFSYRGALERVTFPAALTGSLQRLSRTFGVTLYITLLAGLKAVFFRYSGQEDLIVGGLADGRRRPELENVLGNFLNVVAIRSKPRADQTFAQYLLDVRQSVVSGLVAAEIPFGRVVEEVHPVRDGSGHPIFQTFLAFQPHAEVFAEGWETSRTPVSPCAAKFDLYIEVDERPQQTAARLMYRTDLFEAATIARLAEHWMTLLAGAAEAPETALGDLPLLTADERERMKCTWNRTERPVPVATLHDLVAEQARRTPDAAAIEFEGTCWSYAEVEQQAERLAVVLRRAGACRGRLVAVSLERSHLLPVALLAVLKTGAAYLPLDPRTPLARRLLCLEDADPVVVLTNQRQAGELPATAATVLVIEDALRETVTEEEPRRAGLPGTLSPDAAAYVIHTSGSTGRPKAVEISHRALVNLLVSMRERPGFKAADTLLAMTTISFDIAGLEMFLPLISGGKVVVVSREVALDPYLLGPEIERSGCTVLQATPATWRSLLGSGWSGRKGLRVLCGGEAMTRDLAEALLALGLEVWNVYGPTETTIWSMVERVTTGIGPVPVGRPIANTTAYILDARQQPVPVNVTGELYIGGLGVATGYRGQEELTAQKFVTVAAAGHARLYRTGDYALYRADGQIEVQGRADNQVKVRGYRIELEDVESALAAHPEVGLAAARVWPEAAGGNRLSAYLVGKRGAAPPEAAALREFLKTRVPDYMIPSDVVALDAMPLTANGKIDRKALLPPAQSGCRVLGATPVTELERRLAGIWAELLGVPAVGMEDQFFELGGHSLLVARLQQRIAAEFNSKLPMAALYHAPVLARQAELIRDSQGSRHNARIISFGAVDASTGSAALFWMEPTPLIVNLARSLAPEMPLLGVTMTQADLDELGPAASLRAIAGCYAQSIRRSQPRGPYRLGGLCVGGILAYEVASQLRAAGQEVALVMLDAENPVFYKRFDTLAVEWNKLVFYGRRAFQGNGGEMFRRHVRSRVRRLFRVDQADSTEMTAIGNAILAAAFHYEPPTYAGDVLLLVPRDRPAAVNYLPGWRGVVEGRLTWIEVQGHHDELLLVEFAEGIARVVGEYLQVAV